MKKKKEVRHALKFRDVQNSDSLTSAIFIRYTVKLGLYVHGLVRIHSVITFSPSITDIANRRTCTFFSDKTYRTWPKIGYYVPIFPPGALFCPFFGSFFGSRACHPPPFSFDFNFRTCFPAHDALKGDFTIRKASNEWNSRRRSIFRGGSLAWTRGTGPAGQEIAFWIERTVVSTYLFSFPLGYVITEFHCIWMQYGFCMQCQRNETLYYVHCTHLGGPLGYTHTVGSVGLGWLQLRTLLPNRVKPTSHVYLSVDVWSVSGW